MLRFQSILNNQIISYYENIDLEIILIDDNSPKGFATSCKDGEAAIYVKQKILKRT